jgi:hypothetical protein
MSPSAPLPLLPLAAAPLRFDEGAFRLRHTLLGHPTLELGNLARVVLELPREDVFFSSGLVPKDTDFDRAHLEHRTGLSLEATVGDLTRSDSYVMVRAPERHPSFHGLYRALLAQVEGLMQAQGVGRRAVDPMLYLFLASPNSVTPFHVDRYSTLLLQFRGTKEVQVSPAWDERVVSAQDLEAFAARSGVRVPYRPAFESAATRFTFGPGDALHIPFAAPHAVKNGPGDVSVSLSIIFQTEVTARHLRVMHLNHALRRRLAPLGFRPTPANRSVALDAVKDGVQRVLGGLRGRDVAAPRA